MQLDFSLCPVLLLSLPYAHRQMLLRAAPDKPPVRESLRPGLLPKARSHVKAVDARSGARKKVVTWGRGGHGGQRAAVRAVGGGREGAGPRSSAA